MNRSHTPLSARHGISGTSSLLRIATLLREVLEGTPAPETMIDESLARIALERHQVGPLLHAAASNGRHSASPRVRELLSASYRNSAERRNSSLMQLDRVGRQFAERKISWIVLKGTTQAEQLYADPAWRSSADIDILVSSNDFPEAFDTLLQLGFFAAHPRVPASRLLRKPMLAAVREVTLISRGDRSCAIDLHQRLYGKHVAKGVPFGNDRRTFSLQLKQRPGLIPSPALGPGLALYMIAHGALSLWVRLKWLVDLVPLFQKLSDQEILESREYARRGRVESSFAASLLLLRAFFPLASLSPLSSWLEEQQHDPQVRRRLEHYISAISLDREAKRSPLDSALVSFVSNWLFFEAAPTRARLLISAPASTLMRRLASLSWKANLALKMPFYSREM